MFQFLCGTQSDLEFHGRLNHRITREREARNRFIRPTLVYNDICGLEIPSVTVDYASASSKYSLCYHSVNNIAWMRDIINRKRSSNSTLSRFLYLTLPFFLCANNRSTTNEKPLREKMVLSWALRDFFPNHGWEAKRGYARIGSGPTTTTFICPLCLCM